MLGRWARLICGLFLIVPAACGRYPDDGADTSAILGVNAPSAREVTFHCSTDDFAARPASRTADGFWFVTGDVHSSFRYFFLVDGEVALPDCLEREQDDYGGENCIYSR